MVRLTLQFDYEDTARVRRLLSRFSADVVDSSYAAETRLELQLPAERLEEFRSAFLDALSGRGSAQRVDARA